MVKSNITKLDIETTVKRCGSFRKAAEALNMKYPTFRMRAHRYGITSPMGQPRRDNKNLLTKETIRTLLITHKNCRQVARILGFSYQTIYRKAREYNLIGKQEKEYKLDDILAGKVPTYSQYRLKKKLLTECGWKYECVKCGIGETWQDAPITLQLDHIDGNRTNHHISNLRLLCPNCHSQTDTFMGKNKRRYKKSELRALFYSNLSTNRTDN